MTNSDHTIFVPFQIDNAKQINNFFFERKTNKQFYVFLNHK